MLLTVHQLSLITTFSMVSTTAHYYAPNTRKALACGKDLVDSALSLFNNLSFRRFGWLYTSLTATSIQSPMYCGCTTVSSGGWWRASYSNFFNPKDVFSPPSLLTCLPADENYSQEDINLCYYTDNVAVWLIDISKLNICIVIVSIISCGGNLDRQPLLSA